VRARPPYRRLTTLSANTAAVISSLIRGARGSRHGIDPQRYLTQLPANLPATLLGHLDQWLPDVWLRNQTAAGG
jgi:hypothetical protein